MSDYILESFKDFCNNNNINEAASPQELKDAEKAYAKLKKAFSDLKDASSEFKSAMYYLEGNAPTPEAKKWAGQTYHDMKGNFDYVVRGDLSKYFNWVEEKYQKTLAGVKVKPKQYNVRVPKAGDFSKEALLKVLRAIDGDKEQANRSMYYERGARWTMLASRSGGSFGGDMTSDSSVRGTLKNIMDFMKKAPSKQVDRWVQMIKQETGYTFRLTQGYSDYLYIEW